MAAKKCLICNSAFRGRADARTCSARCRKRLQLVRQSLRSGAFNRSPFTIDHALAVDRSPWIKENGKSTVNGKRKMVKGLTALAVGIFGLLALLLSSSAPRVEAATSSYFNFQMRLLTSSGAVVADGNYHIEFKLYKAANSTGSSQGSCTGDTNCLWTETRTTGNLVRVVNGYFSVQLGSVTALPSIDWNQELWLGVRIGGSGGTASWEAIELTSDGTATGNKIALTAVPYAFSANKLQATSGTITNTLQFATPTVSNKTLTLPDETGTVCTTGSVCSGYQTAGSYFLQGGNSFAATAILGTNDSNSLTFETNNTTQVTIAVGGATTFKNSTNSATAFQIQNASSTNILTIDSTKGTITQPFVQVSYLGGNDVTGSTNSGTGSAGNGFMASTVVGHYEYAVKISDGVGGTCSATAGSAIGCEFQIYDVTNPASPTYIGGADSSGTTNGGTSNKSFNNIAVSGRYAYIVTDANATACSQSAGSAIGCELMVFDVSNPSSPTYVAGMDVSGSATGTVSLAVYSVAVSGRYLYLGTNGSSASACSQSAGSANYCELQVYDISNPAAPTYVGGLDNSGTTNGGTSINQLYDIDISGTYAYTAWGDDAGTCSATPGSANGCELKVLDINDPLNPTYKGGADATGTTNGGTGAKITRSVMASGRYLYLAKDSDATACSQTPGSAIGCELMVFDVSNPTSPTYVGGADASGSTNSGTGSTSSARELFLGGRYLYVPLNTTTGGTCSQTAGSAIGCELQIYDVVTPASPTYVGGADASGTTNGGSGNAEAHSVFVSGRYAYVTFYTTSATTCSGTAGSAIGCELQVYDVSGIEASSVLAHSLEAGSLSVQNNASVFNNLSIGGGLSVGQNVAIQGDIGVAGKALFQNQTNSTTAFQIQNAAGSSVVNVSTVTLQNLITNSSFESNTSGWAKLQGAETTFAVATSGAKDGTQSLQVTTDGVTANQGAKYTYFFKPNTTYSFSIYASVSSGSIATFDLGTSINSTISTCLSGQTVTTTVTRYSCSFTTGATTTGSDYVFARRSTAATVTIYLDAAQLELGSTAGMYRGDVYPNLISNPNLETNSNGWSIKGTATSVAVSEDYAAFGNRSLKLVTGTAANNGASYSYPLTASTRYSLSIWLKRDTSSTATINIGRQDVSGTDVDCLTGQMVDTTWRQFTCTFTTGATITPPTSLYVKQTDLTTDNIYIDGFTLVASGYAQTFYSPAISVQSEPLYGNITLNGGNTGELQAWQLNANSLPADREAHTSIVANGYVYAIGGANSGAQSTVYYAKLNADGSTGSWSTNANALPAGRENHTSVAANSYVYVIGGNNSGAQSTVYYAKLNADGSTGTWSTNANALPAARNLASSVAANGYVYVLGGDNGGFQSTVYYAKLNADGSTGTWSTNANALPAARARHSSVVANGYVYVIGGATNSTVYYAKLNADGSTGTWTTNVNPLPENRFQHSSVVANGYLYVIAGQDGVDTFANIFYAKLNADGSVGSWSTAANSLPIGKLQHSSVAANGYIYSIAGGPTAGYKNVVYYTSASRVLVGGSLDLVGLGGQNLSDGGDFSQGSTGGSLTAGNTQIVGSLQVQGQASFAQGVAVLGNLTIGGDLAPNKAPTISTTAQTINSVVTTGDVGNWTAMAMPADGRAVIAHLEWISASDNDIQITKCDNASCTTATNTELVNATEGIAEDFDLAIGSDGLPIVVYQPETSGDLIAVHCGNAACTSGNTTTTLESINDIGEVPSIAIGVDGFPIIAYVDSTNSDLRAYHCTNVTCSAGSSVLVDANALDNQGTATVIGKDGLPVIAFQTTSDALRVVKCQTLTCSSVHSAVTAVDVTNVVGKNISMVIGSDGNPFIVHFDETADDYLIFACSDNECNNTATEGTETTIETSGIDGQGYSGLALGVDGMPVIAMYFGTTAIEVAHCENLTCSRYNKTSVEDTANDVGKWTSMVIGLDTIPIIAYADETGNDLRVAKCADIGCFETASAKYSSGISLGSANSYFQDIYAVNYFGKQFSLSGFDVAEEYEVEDTSLKPGEAVALNPTSSKLKRATATDRALLLGVVSTQPGIALKDYTANRTDTRLIALVGKVPLKVKGQISIGDPLTIGDTPGVAAKATSAGMILGRAMQSFDGDSGTITVFVQTSYYVPTVNLQGNDFLLMQDLFVNGLAKISNLEVSGDASFKGNIIVKGHYVTGGDAPQTEVLAANTSANEPQITIDGNDTTGSIKIITIQSVQPGNLVKITFNQPFGKKPKIFLHPSNLEASTVQIYREVQVDYFIIKLVNPLAADRTYEFDYFVIE